MKFGHDALNVDPSGWEPYTSEELNERFGINLPPGQKWTMTYTSLPSENSYIVRATSEGQK